MRKRNNEIVLWLTNDEYSRLKKQVAKTDLSVQAYLRLMIENIHPKERAPHGLTDVLKKLSCVNNNMYLIAHSTAASSEIKSEDYWENVKLLELAIHELLRVMYGE